MRQSAESDTDAYDGKKKPIISSSLTKFIALAGLLLGIYNAYITSTRDTLDKKREVANLAVRARSHLAGIEGARFIPGGAPLTAADSEELEKAKALIDDIIRIDKESSVGLALRGIYFAKRELYEDARSDYDAALVLDLNNAEALNGIGQIYLISREYQEAAEYFQRAVEADPLKVAAYVNWAKALAREGKLEDARVVLELGVQTAGNSPPFLLNLGNVYFESGRYDYAVIMYSRCLEMDSSYNEHAKRNLEIATRRLEQVGKGQISTNSDEPRVSNWAD